MKKLTSIPNLNILSQKLTNPLLNVALHFLIGFPFIKKQEVLSKCTIEGAQHKKIKTDEVSIKVPIS